MPTAPLSGRAGPGGGANWFHKPFLQRFAPQGWESRPARPDLRRDGVKASCAFGLAPRRGEGLPVRLSLSPVAATAFETRRGTAPPGTAGLLRHGGAPRGGARRGTAGRGGAQRGKDFKTKTKTLSVHIRTYIQIHAHPRTHRYTPYLHACVRTHAGSRTHAASNRQGNIYMLAATVCNRHARSKRMCDRITAHAFSERVQAFAPSHVSGERRRLRSIR